MKRYLLNFHDEPMTSVLIVLGVCALAGLGSSASGPVVAVYTLFVLVLAVVAYVVHKVFVATYVITADTYDLGDLDTSVERCVLLITTLDGETALGWKYKHWKDGKSRVIPVVLPTLTENNFGVKSHLYHCLPSGVDMNIGYMTYFTCQSSHIAFDAQAVLDAFKGTDYVYLWDYLTDLIEDAFEKPADPDLLDEHFDIPDVLNHLRLAVKQTLPAFVPFGISAVGVDVLPGTMRVGFDATVSYN